MLKHEYSTTYNVCDRCKISRIKFSEKYCKDCIESGKIKTEDKYICNVCYINNKFSETPISIHPLTSLCDFCQTNQTSWYIAIEINYNITPCCQKEMKLKLYPDYTSSGIWCFHCGCNLSNLQLPDGLIDLCEIWNDLWDRQINDEHHIADKYFGETFVSAGKFLCESINQYCYCEFNITEEEIIQDVIRCRNYSKE